MNARTSHRAFENMVAAIALVALVLTVAGCAPTTPPPSDTPAPAPSTPPAAPLPTETPGITGSITYIAAGEGAALGTISVEGGAQPEGAVSDKAVVTITKETALVDAGGNTIAPSALQVGNEVKVWFEGPVAESYPVQGAASAVQVTGNAPE